MSGLQIFVSSEFGRLNVINQDGKIYIDGIQPCSMLGYSNPRDAILRHCKIEVVVFHHTRVSTGKRADNLKSIIIQDESYTNFAKQIEASDGSISIGKFDKLLVNNKCDKYGYTLDSLNIKSNNTIDTHIANENTTMDRVSIPIHEVENKLEYGYGEEKEEEKEKEEEEETSLAKISDLNKFEKVKSLYESIIGPIDNHIRDWLF